MTDQLPLLLILSPVTGFLITLVAARSERDLIRHLAISNVICSAILVAVALWQLNAEHVADRVARQALTDEAVSSGAGSNLREVVDSRMDRQRVERLGHKWLVVDGVNIGPMIFLIALTGCVFWQLKISTVEQNWFFPFVLLFESMALAALMSYDLRLFLMTAGLASMMMGLLLGLWGGPDRREMTVRFLLSQFCGGSIVMLGFAMLVVAIPWMKIEDSPAIPPLTWNIVTMVYEIQKWTSGNPLAFQYQNEVFPWIMLVLSIGFGLQVGLFPFHQWLMLALGRAPGALVSLLIAGLISISGTAWLRFVMPLAPELMAAFDWLVLVPALGSAIWGAVRAVAPGPPRQRMAYLFLSLMGLSLLGRFSYSRAALSGMILMQQQLIATFCAAFVIFSPDGLFQKPSTSALDLPPLDSFGRTPSLAPGNNPSLIARSSTRIRVRPLMGMACLPLLGLFASGFIIFSELLRESLILVLCLLLVGGLILLSVDSLLRSTLSESQNRSPMGASGQLRGPALIMLLFVIVTNLFPQRILATFEPDLIRVFQKYEQPLEASEIAPE